jgi:hypothetical protein
MGWKLKLDISYISNSNRSLSLIVYYQTQAGCKPNPIKITKDIGISLVPLLPKVYPALQGSEAKLAFAMCSLGPTTIFSSPSNTH